MEQQGTLEKIWLFLKANPFFVPITLLLPIGLGWGLPMMLPATPHNGICIIILTISATVLLVILEIVWYKRHILTKRNKMISASVASLFAIVFIIIITQLDFQGNKKTEGRNQTAIATGNNSPAANQFGNGNVLTQNSPNSPVYYGVIDKTREDIRTKALEDMNALQQQNKDKFLADFPLGYILFAVIRTHKERNEIIPWNSPWDDIIKIDWKSGYNVSFSDETIVLSLPTIAIKDIITYEKLSFTISRNVVPPFDVILGFQPDSTPEKAYRLVIRCVSSNKDSVIMAVGVQVLQGKEL
jgi:hypothetical protein